MTSLGATKSRKSPLRAAVPNPCSAHLLPSLPAFQLLSYTPSLVLASHRPQNSQSCPLTLSLAALQDILTDLSAESEALELDCGVQDCSAHKVGGLTQL